MIEQTLFGHMPDGHPITSYTLTNQNNMSVEVLTLGATIRSWQLGDPKQTDIVLGFDCVDDYLADQGYLGRTVGRYANRIENGLFKIDGNPIKVSTNLQGNSLHGGVDGFHNRIWTVTKQANSAEPSICLSLISEDGDQGFPGTLSVDVTMQLDKHNCLSIEYRAISNQDTVFNPTQHTYFNLAGHDSGQVFEQLIKVHASHYTPANEQAIPTGELKSVKGTAFDLQHFTKLGTLIHQDDAQIKAASGLDHNWCVDGFDAAQQHLQLAAEVIEPISGRKLIARTTMPGVQVYTGNFIGSDLIGKNDQHYCAHQGFCIESQFYPNSPNVAHFPSPILRAGQSFVSTTSYQIIETEGDVE
ncbi:aldose epimerase family protein [Aliiglaciecola sp. LCG003]|uniref:aldose epimerase family protein n=1 Tax=Aliiglaciecola sp. LCG003 TaxID=3053655 RepID=UPI0025740AAE|nr:aldose epimerase family protein [Aliiglaciecola sp. LCG003]WJG08739.1 aldose epimerase family protein [Aliiglaciecola sp. LCG003]